MSARGPAGSGIPSRAVLAVPAALALLAAGALFLQTRSYGLPGHDSYPLIVTCRVQSWGDFVGLWVDSLMQGRYPGAFYRPVFGLTVAVDHALWGLSPAGWQATGAVLFGACGLVVFAFSRRLLGGTALAGPLVAMVVFLLHPAHFEVVPVPSRRPEMLCALFMMLAIAAELSPRALARKRPGVLPAMLSLLAMLSKETAVVLPVLVFAAVALYSRRDGALRRLAHATTASAAHVVALAGVLAVRVAVLGEVGGHGPAALDPRYLPGAVRDVLALVIAPQPVMRATALPWIVSAVLGVAGAAAFAWLRDGAGADEPDRRGAWPRAFAFATVWLVALSAVYMAAGRLEPWYLLLPDVAGCIVAAVAAEVALASWAARSVRARAAGAVVAAALVTLMGWQARYSPFVHAYDEYRRAEAASREFRDELRRRVDAAPPGSVIPAPPLPSWVRVTPGRPTLFGVAVLTDYSVQAWCDLVFPDRRLRVLRGRETAEARPGETVIALTGLRRGFESPLPPRVPGP